ncbi:hypothetical protein B0A49_01349 [Cryomyces minteri]|uniref:Uncharacterized protein n=1 Tax=Cryomyces minteri TaxID=331657 RepID=A0A4U0XZR7_9PEZI|nr:hypothetical protein B0A49_01349 [Cryomyces minteri]
MFYHGHFADDAYSLSSTKDASVSHRTGLQIDALDISDDSSTAVLAGREILKTVRVDGNNCAEHFNLRAAISNNAWHNETAARQRDTLNVHDVKWSNRNFSTHIATAATSGKVILYDVQKPSVEIARLHEHSRQVHKIAFNPHGGHLLLSASQDGTVRLWDLRALRREAIMLSSRSTFSGGSDGVRDVKWSPTNSLEFAIATDSGGIQRWDFQQPKAPKLRIAAHNKICHTIDWHPDGKHLASASSDKSVKVWDFTSEQRHHKAGWAFKTPYTTDVHFAPKVVDRRNMQSFALSPTGEMSFMTQKRSRGDNVDFDYYMDERLSPNERGKSESPSKEGSGRSSADDGVDESFLSSAFRKRHGRTGSNKSTKSVCNTPPSFDESIDKRKMPVMTLDETLSIKGASKPNQIACRGVVPGAFNPAVFSYLAQKYKTRLYLEPPTVEAMANIQEVFERNADYAQRTGSHRLAQSWRLVGLAVFQELRRRDKARRLLRMTSEQNKPTTGGSRTSHEGTKEVSIKKETGVAPVNPAITALRASEGPQGYAASAFESTSNVPTPLARPLSGTVVSDKAQFASLPNPDNEDVLQLPPSLGDFEFDDIITNESVNAALPPSPDDSGMPQWQSSTSRPEDRRAMMSNWRVPPKTPLNLEPPNWQGIDIHLGDHSRESDVSDGASSEEVSERARPVMEAFVPLAPIHELLGHHAPPGDQKKGQKPDTTPLRTRDQETKDADDDRDQIMQDLGLLRKNNQQMQSFSSESDAYASSKESTSLASSDARDNVDLEASGTIVPDQPPPDLAISRQSSVARDPPLHNTAQAGCAAPQNILIPDPNNEPFIPSGFLPGDDNVDTEGATPFTLIALLLQLLRFHTFTLSDVQTSSHILLLLTPLLPRTHPLPQPQIDALAVSYSDHLISLDMSPAQVATVLSTSHAHLNAAGLPAPQAEAILSAYHDQLHSLSLFNSAAYLRRLAYPAYPAVYEQALKDTQTSLRCQHCGDAINNPRNRMRCENCGERQAGCPVCGCERSPFEGGGRSNTHNHNINGSDYSPKHHNAHGSTPTPHNHPPQETHDIASASPLLLTACLLCNHAAHSACLVAWHNSSSNAHPSSSSNTDGGCPTPGCLCDCAAGTWRAAKALTKHQQQQEARRRSGAEKANREKLMEGSRRGKGIGLDGRALSVGAPDVVVGDEWRVGDSRAVVGATKLVGEAEGVGVGGGVGMGKRVGWVDGGQKE